ncbi:MAG TPA: LysM domain-containing protein [Candidatus Limnocylindrales bacterium]
MTAVAGPGSVIPPDTDPALPDAAASPVGPGEVGPILPEELVRSICPYLGTGAGWRLAVPERAHRCLAVSPAPQLALEKQARLCLGATHETCATFKAARAAAAGWLDDDASEALPTQPGRVRRWSVPRTQATVLDVGRGSVDLGAVARQRSSAQVGLVLLALVAFGALILTRLSATPLAGAGPTSSLPVVAASTLPTGGSSPLVAAATATPAPTSRPTVAPTPSVSPSVAPSPSVAASSSPATPSATPAGSFRLYTVRGGDTLSGIATRFHTTVKAIRAANGITDPTLLQIGQVLRIPQ